MCFRSNLCPDQRGGAPAMCLHTPQKVGSCAPATPPPISHTDRATPPHKRAIEFRLIQLFGFWSWITTKSVRETLRLAKNGRVGLTQSNGYLYSSPLLRPWKADISPLPWLLCRQMPCLFLICCLCVKVFFANPYTVPPLKEHSLGY